MSLQNEDMQRHSQKKKITRKSNKIKTGQIDFSTMDIRAQLKKALSIN